MCIVDSLCTLYYAINIFCAFVGCVVVLGGSHMFRFNDPQEAARLRKEGNKTHLNLSRLSFLSRSATDLVRSFDNLSGLVCIQYFYLCSIASVT